MRCMYLASVWPQHNASAAALHSLGIAHSLSSRGMHVTIAGPSAPGPVAEDIRQRHQNVHIAAAPPNRGEEFSALLTAVKPDIVIFDRFITEEKFGWQVKSQRPEALRVVDTQDLHWVRDWRLRHRDSWANLASIPTPPLSWSPLVRELASILRSDLSLIISNTEAKLLSEPPFSVPAHKLSTAATFFYDLPLPPTLDFANRKDFCMIGNFRHKPNHDAVHWAAKLWPRIRSQLPDAELHVYGAYADEPSKALEKPALGLYIKGFTHDAIKTMRKYRINFAPLRAGAGIKGKITDGWAAGCAAVTTPVGAESMDLDGEFGGAVATAEDELISAAVQLYTDEKLFNAAAKLGQKTLALRFSFEANAPKLLADLEAAYSRLAQHRGTDLIGEVLWYHGNRSDEYFSRWIALKESLRSAAKPPPSN